MNKGIVISPQHGPRRIRQLSTVAPAADGAEAEVGARVGESWWVLTLARPAANASTTNAAITRTINAAR